MRKLATALNVICLFLALITLFRHGIAGLLLSAAYALALGSIHGKQKTALHLTTVVFNALLFLVGVAFIGIALLGRLGDEGVGMLVLFVGIAFVMLIFVPAFNISIALKMKSENT